MFAGCRAMSSTFPVTWTSARQCRNRHFPKECLYRVRNRYSTRARVRSREEETIERSSRSVSQVESKRSSVDDTGSSQSGLSPKVLGSLSVVGGLVALGVAGVLLKDQIKIFLDTFIALVDDWGPLGYLAYILVYAVLELLAVPAIPLTMTAGVIFGVLPGTAVVSISGTMAATGAFLISRYVARERFANWASQNPKFAAIDRAIGKDGFRVVALLRLSPLLPLAASNYLYGLTSVDLGSYVAASWLGMLPGTFAYVGAGSYGSLLVGATEGSGAGIPGWQLAVGAGCTIFALWYIGNLAKEALADVSEE